MVILERETESLNKARELLRNNTFPPHQGPPSFSYQHGDLHIGDPITPYKPMMYPPRLFSPSAPLPPPPPPLVQPYLYPPRSPTPPLSLPYRRTDYYLHNNGTHHQTLTNSGCGGRSPPESGYNFIGAPVANGSRVAPPLWRPLPPHNGYN
ncbi:Zinc finger protein JAGGED-like [Raphanus sativus]|nr:Zinc finger protein JAGGED-like [Raphanus sativus]